MILLLVVFIGSVCGPFTQVSSSPQLQLEQQHTKSRATTTTVSRRYLVSNNQYYHDDATNYTYRSTSTGYPQWMQILFTLFVIGVLLVLCIFLPLCYPLSLWDLVSVYFHWEECDTGSTHAEYTIHPCDIMVC